MKFKFKPRATIIYEGKSESYFIKRMEEFFEVKYVLTKIEFNGDTRIPLMYRKEKRKNNYNDIRVMFDLDGTKNIDDIIKLFDNAGVEIDKSDIYFISPDIELLFILCKLKKAKLIHNKTKQVIEDIYHFSSYNKTEQQIKQIVNSITKSEFIEMFQLINKYLSKNDNVLKSTNYDILLKDIFNITE